MSKSKIEIADFYDNRENLQKKVGINLRHLSIVSKIKSRTSGRPVKNILEIGCGIGTVTSLLAKKFPGAHITACDISPKSIETANMFWGNKHPNISFLVSDMTDFQSSDLFDVIVLPDVLEHIPFEEHNNLFGLFYKHSTPNTQIFINIPSPYYNRWTLENYPELLQVIDLEIYSNNISDAAHGNNFEIFGLENYSIFRKGHDYQFIQLIRKDRPNELFPAKEKWRLILQKQWLRFFG